MSLQSLPEELLVEIAGWVGTDTHNPQDGSIIITYGTKPLSNFALCSHLFNKIVTPILYARFCQTGEAAVPAFLNLVLAQPEKGAHIRQFVGTEISEDIELAIDWNNDDHTRAIGALTSLCSSDEDVDNWYSYIVGGNWEAHVALLLCLLPNLMELRFEEFSREDHVFTESVFTTAARCQVQNDLRPFSLQLLTSVHISPATGMEIDSIRPLVEIPSVKTAKFWGLGGSNVELWQLDSIGKSNVEDLALYDCVINGAPMTALLKRFGCLKKLYYNHHAAKGEYYDFFPQYFEDGLTHLRPYLEELAILHAPISFCMDSRNDGNMPINIGLLSGFECLRSIKMNSDTLLGKMCLQPPHDTAPRYHRRHLVDLLPKSLQKLAIIDCGTGILEHGRVLLKRREQSVPNLVDIQLVYWTSDHDNEWDEQNLDVKGYDKETAERLKLECAKTGLILSISFTVMKYW